MKTNNLEIGYMRLNNVELAMYDDLSPDQQDYIRDEMKRGQGLQALGEVIDFGFYDLNAEFDLDKILALI